MHTEYVSLWKIAFPKNDHSNISGLPWSSWLCLSHHKVILLPLPLNLRRALWLPWQNVAEVMLHDFKGWVIKGNMTSSGNLFVRMLTLGTRSPSYKKTQVTWRGHMQVSWLIAQLRSQLTVIINCQISERMSLQMILASSIWVTSADAAWSKGTYHHQALPKSKIHA